MGLHCSIFVLGIVWRQIAAGWLPRGCCSCPRAIVFCEAWLQITVGVRVSIMSGKGTVADRTGVAAIRLL